MNIYMNTHIYKILAYIYIIVCDYAYTWLVGCLCE